LRFDADMEKVVGRLSLEQTVSATRWQAGVQIPGGYVLRDANGQAIAYVYSRATETDARRAKVLTEDEAAASPSISRACRNYWGIRNEGSETRTGEIEHAN
jgi:hypothetical protein